MMDAGLFRKDEIWFFDKKEKNNIYSLAEFKDIREDLVFSKAYLHGRFGGLPE
jgi:5-methylthioribose kinase